MPSGLARGATNELRNQDGHLVVSPYPPRMGLAPSDTVTGAFFSALSCCFWLAKEGIRWPRMMTINGRTFLVAKENVSVYNFVAPLSEGSNARRVMMCANEQICAVNKSLPCVFNFSRSIKAI